MLLFSYLMLMSTVIILAAGEHIAVDNFEVVLHGEGYQVVSEELTFFLVVLIIVLGRFLLLRLNEHIEEGRHVFLSGLSFSFFAL